ncbi:hypothetical protein TRFO_10383 [Tritrichomonas foetus]|uniref:Ubiquitin-like domain-containing protein n=1 Tax=Tritrichomonas foetus TaxID=1144522 RepID=A0A1J4JDH8_9EUKA|nr:hypothetical protein TRFO_10383 [Tritrichomonas foetus]|eukprot:OHS95731.1 hypothetical protein TRFO_10383 [Tritrichomonas foetus]
MKKKKSIQVLTPDRTVLQMHISAGSTIKELKKELKKIRPEYNRLNFYFNSIRLSSDVLLNDINQPPGWSIISTVSNKFPEEYTYTFYAENKFKLTLKNNTLIKDVKSLLLTHVTDYDGPLFLVVEGIPLPNLIPIGSIGLEEKQSIVIMSEDPAPYRYVTYTYQLPQKQIPCFSCRANSPVSELISAFSPYIPLHSSSLNIKKENVKFYYHHRTLENDCQVGDWGVTENDVIFVKVKGNKKPKILRKDSRKPFAKPTLGKKAQKFNRHYIPIGTKSYSTQNIKIQLNNSANSILTSVLGSAPNSGHATSNSISDYLNGIQPYEVFFFKVENSQFSLSQPSNIKMKDFLSDFEKMIGEKVVFENSELSKDSINVFKFSNTKIIPHIFAFTFNFNNQDVAFNFDKPEITVAEAISRISKFYDADPNFIQLIQNNSTMDANSKLNENEIANIERNSSHVYIEIQKISVIFQFEGENFTINFFKVPTIRDAKRAFCLKKGISVSGVSFSIDSIIPSDNSKISSGTFISVELLNIHKVNVIIDNGKPEVMLFEMIPNVLSVKEQISKKLNVLPAAISVKSFEKELQDDFILVSYIEILHIHIKNLVYNFEIINVRNQNKTNSTNQTNESSNISDSDSNSSYNVWNDNCFKNRNGVGKFELAFDSHPTAEDATFCIASMFSVEYENITLSCNSKILMFSDLLPSETIKVEFGPLKFHFDHENGFSFSLEFYERPNCRDTIQLIAEKVGTPADLLLLANDEDILCPWEKLPPRVTVSEIDMKEGFFHFMVPKQRPFPIVLNEDAPIEVELSKIAERCGSVASDIKLILDGRVLQPFETLRSLNMASDDIITIYINQKNE